MKHRQNLYLDPKLADALTKLAARPGVSKSQIIGAALSRYIESQGGAQVEAATRIRLDRITRELALTRRDIDVLLESLSLFVRYQLMVTAPLPEADRAAQAVGRERFEAFIGQVGRTIAAGKRTLPGGSDEAAR